MRLFFCVGVAAFFALLSCSNEIEDTQDTREIRGHLVQLEGVMHADGAYSALQLCAHCHGSTLQGGDENFVPSCYSCHGEYWNQSNVDSNAPADHLLDHGGFLHKAASTDPAEECAVCHQFENQVQTSLGTRPHCLSCHGEKW